MRFFVVVRLVVLVGKCNCFFGCYFFFLLLLFSLHSYSIVRSYDDADDHHNNDHDDNDDNDDDDRNVMAQRYVRKNMAN